MSRGIAQLTTHEWKIEFLREAVVEMLKSLNDRWSTGFEVPRRGGEMWLCFPVLTLYCIIVPEGNDMLIVNHGISVRRHCVKCKRPVEFTYCKACNVELPKK